MTPIRLLAAGLMLTVAVAPALAQQQQRVYQWKDANGITHYTDVAPTQGHQTRDIGVHDGKAATPVAKPTGENDQCRDARSNLQRLQGGEALGIDTDGDGKPDRALSADERKAQLELNQAAVKAYCTPGGK